MPENIVTVSQLTQRIKALIEADVFLQGIQVKGEISNYKVYPSGHRYFTLKDAESTIKCVMFRTDAEKVSFTPSDGQKVVASGRISVYPRDGVYQFYINHMIPDGVGALTQAYEELKAKLEAEGLFDKAHKQLLPTFPQKVVLITSPAGAAVMDMIRIFKRRWTLCKLVIIPVRVQGVEAPAEIAGAIRYANRHKLGDVIITGRGGGSIEDLWAFNEEQVARAIFASVIPIVSAVGHEPDFTISDFVADVRAATPSHAAEIVTPDNAEILAQLAQVRQRLQSGINRKMEMCRYKLTSSQKALRSPERVLADKRQHLDTSLMQLQELTKRMLKDNRNILASKADRLDALSPLKVLSRGYSIIRLNNGHVIKSSKDVKNGDILTINPENGTIVCKVVETVEKK